MANMSEAPTGAYEPSGQYPAVDQVLAGAGADVTLAWLKPENARALWDTAQQLLEEPTP